MTNITERMTFKYFKSQEIPLFYYDARAQVYHDNPSMKQVRKDFSEMELTVHDNGDEKVCLEISLGPQKKLSLICDMFLPIVRGHNEGTTLPAQRQKVMMAAAGNTVILKEIKAKIVQR